MEDLVNLGKFIDNATETATILAGMTVVIDFQDSAFQNNNRWITQADEYIDLRSNLTKSNRNQLSSISSLNEVSTSKADEP